MPATITPTATPTLWATLRGIAVCQWALAIDAASGIKSACGELWAEHRAYSAERDEGAPRHGRPDPHLPSRATDDLDELLLDPTLGVTLLAMGMCVVALLLMLVQGLVQCTRALWREYRLGRAERRAFDEAHPAPDASVWELLGASLGPVLLVLAAWGLVASLLALWG